MKHKFLNFYYLFLNREMQMLLLLLFFLVKSASGGRHRRTSATPPRAKALVVDSPTEETLKPCTPKSGLQTHVIFSKISKDKHINTYKESGKVAVYKYKIEIRHSFNLNFTAMSYPGTRSSRSCFRKVRIQSDPSPVPAVVKEQKVRLVSPRRSKGANVDCKKGVRPTKRNILK